MPNLLLSFLISSIILSILSLEYLLFSIASKILGSTNERNKRITVIGKAILKGVSTPIKKGKNMQLKPQKNKVVLIGNVTKPEPIPVINTDKPYLNR